MDMSLPFLTTYLENVFCDLTWHDNEVACKQQDELET